MVVLSCVAAPALAQRSLGSVEVAVDGSVLLVRVSGTTAELNALALTAFNTHGRYKIVASGHTYDIRFSPAGPTQVRVDVTKGLGGSPVASETAGGKTLREALLRAADIAVEKTNGLGLKGYFTARLAFIRDLGRAKEVCTSDLFFSSGEVKQVTRNNAQSLSPRWAPDGSKILFTSFFKSGFPDIYLLDLASNQWSTFASFKGTNTGARFSPTGRQVAMVLTGEGTPEIYVSDAQGRGVSRRTRSDLAKASPCWSPDGGRIVFAMGDSLPQLYVIPAAGGGAPQRLSAGYTYAAEPDWSRANPSKLACTVRVGRSYQVAVYDFGKGKAEVVSKASFDGVEPSWLADGRHLVYTARTPTESRLSILDTATGKSTPISPASFGSALQGNVWTP